MCELNIKPFQNQEMHHKFLRFSRLNFVYDTILRYDPKRFTYKSHMGSNLHNFEITLSKLRKRTLKWLIS